MIRNLETHRFNIKSESKNLIDSVKASFEEYKIQEPSLVGITFFGSRTLSKENTGSDIDFCVHFDSSVYKPEDRSKKRKELLYYFENVAKQKGVTGIPFIVDGSQEMTDRLIKSFKGDVVKNTNSFNHPYKIDKRGVGVLNWGLVSRFFLGIGDGLYKSRQYILERLQSDPNGEKYFQVLMQFLQFCERTVKTEKRPEGLPKYRNFPKSIAEAKEYFLTQPPKITKKE